MFLLSGLMSGDLTLSYEELVRQHVVSLKFIFIHYQNFLPLLDGIKDTFKFKIVNVTKSKVTLILFRALGLI